MIAPQFDEVMTAARKWYYTAIRELVEDAIKRIPAGLTENEVNEWLVDDVNETCDGHEVVIYTAMASMACAASDNDGTIEDVGQLGATETDGGVSRRAYFAMVADAWELLQARHEEWGVSTERKAR